MSTCEYSLDVSKMTTIDDDEKVREASPSPDLRRRMVGEGFVKAVVWQQVADRCTPDAPPVQPPDAPPVEPPDEEKDEKRKAEAKKRQRAQTIRDEEEGWARCYAKTLDDPDAREVVAMVGKAIVSQLVRRAVRVAVVRPQSVFIGEKVAGLRGMRGALVRRLIGAADSNADA